MGFYRFVIWILRFFSRLYFVEVRPVRPDRVPAAGPVILAANHPTSVLDAILLAGQTRRRIHFLGKSALFRNRLIGAILRRLGAIAVYQAQEAEASGLRNAEVFEEVYELFESGGCLGLFPEGRNSPGGKVLQLRTGGARMALGAEARNAYRLGLKIVPVGIHYEHRELFMSAVMLRFGPPLDAAAYAGLHQEDPASAVHRMTEDLQEALRREAGHVEDDQVKDLAHELSEALDYRLAPLALEESGESRESGKSKSRLKRCLWKLLEWYRPIPAETADRFATRRQDQKSLTRVLSAAMAHDPASVSALRRQVDRYQDHLRQTELSRALKRSLEEPVRERLIRLRMTIYMILLAPVALFGLVHNLVPYLVTLCLARLARDEAIRAFAYFGVGLLAFTLTYAALGLWLCLGAGIAWNWMLVYLVLLPPAGFFTLRYRRNILLYRDKILVRAFFWNNAELIRLLHRERQRMIEHFQALASAYGA